MLWVALHFHPFPPSAQAPATLERLAAWACQFTPRVSLEPPLALLAEIQGSLRYFGGVEALVEKLRAGLAELGYEASLALAATPRAALWRARGGRKALKDISVEMLGNEQAIAFLKSIGASTLGEVLALPRDGVAKRCGEKLVADLDRALGKLPEPREFFSLPVRFDAQLELPGAVAQAEGVLFAARRLLVQLEGLLAASHSGVRRFTLDLLHLRGKTSSIEILLASPARGSDRLAQLLRERLAMLSLREPVEALRLRAADFVPLHERTGGMFGDAQAEGEAWAKLAERLQGRLGGGAVYGVTPQPDHRPEHAWRCVEPGEWDPREFRQPGARPLWLVDPARRVARDDLELLAGPERIECGWWDNDEARRDYFVALSGASLVWAYREAGEWFLHGFFA